MYIQRKQSPIPRKDSQEYICPKEFVTSEVQVSRGVKLGATIVWRTMGLYTAMLLMIAFFVVLFVSLFVFPELRKEILGILEGSIGRLLHLL